MAGRRPLPSAVKAARGNPGKRRANDREPEAPAGMPACPDWLPARARECWADLGPTLEGMRVVTAADRLALVLLADAYAEWRAARDEVDSEGPTYETETEAGGRMIRSHPAVAQASDAARRLRALLVEFGLTPSARSRVKAGKPAEDDPAGDLLNRGKRLRARNMKLVRGGA